MIALGIILVVGGFILTNVGGGITKKYIRANNPKAHSFSAQELKQEWQRVAKESGVIPSWVSLVGFVGGFRWWVSLVGFVGGFRWWVSLVGFVGGFRWWVSLVGFVGGFSWLGRSNFWNYCVKKEYFLTLNPYDGET